MRGTEHKLFERLFLGRETQMSDLMDFPSVFLKSHHRKVFHTPAEVLMLASIAEGDFLTNVKAGLLHLALDNLKSISYDVSEEGKKKREKKTSGKKKTN